MIVVTGGAGFIGSNVVKAINEAGRDDILVVDNMTNGAKFHNVVDCQVSDYLDKSAFRALLNQDRWPGDDIDVVFHLGACSTTTEWDGRYMLDNNYQYSKELLAFCLRRQIRLIYASSASVYGAGPTYVEDHSSEAPLNVYGYSKLLFDQYVRKRFTNLSSQVAGLRYFNVYGPREQHKGSMASVAFHFNRQLQDGNKIKLFEGNDGYAAGEQLRDFVFVHDVVAVNLWLFEHPEVSGIFNVGTGRAQTFNDVAKAVIGWHGRGEVEYIPFPDHLRGAYQSYTQADISALRKAGYRAPFASVESGIKGYLDWLHR